MQPSQSYNYTAIRRRTAVTIYQTNNLQSKTELSDEQANNVPFSGPEHISVIRMTFETTA